MKRLFFDLEVSPNVVLSWRTGYKIRITPDNIVKERAIISAAWKWSGGQVTSATWGTDQDDKEVVTRLCGEIEQADEVVAYFGDSFDMPWLRTRALFHGIYISPFVKTVDPLKWVRGKFLFNSNKLDYIARLLGEGQKVETEPGLWRRVVLDKSESALAEMEMYNRQDVVVLERVFNRLSPAMKPTTHVGVLNHGEKWSCPHCGSTEVKTETTRVTALGVIRKQMRCHKCTKYYQISLRVHKEFAEWKQQQPH